MKIGRNEDLPVVNKETKDIWLKKADENLPQRAYLKTLDNTTKHVIL